MKRLGGIWPQVIDFQNLLRAYRRARRGKRSRPGVEEFALGLEHELLALQHELVSGEYRPGPYRQFTVYERKPRFISAAPFRDRVVHHALLNVIEPVLDRTFIYDSYACRRGKGAHRAVDRYQAWAGKYAYALKLDIAAYFPSIDHDILKCQLRRRIKDRLVLGLLDRIIDTGPATDPAPRYFPGDNLFTPLARRIGIPIGNLTSQFFANLYLDGLDHFVKEKLGIKPYLRYVDDMVILGDDKCRLAQVREEIRERAASLRLSLHPRKAHITRTGDGLGLLGYQVWPARRRLRADNGYRFRRRLRKFAAAYARGTAGFTDFNASVQSWIGHARHADTRGLRRCMFAAVPFARGTGLGAPSG